MAPLPPLATTMVCNETLGVLCLGLSFNCFCKQFCYENPHSKEVGECQQVFLLRSQIKEVFSSKFFSKQSGKTRW